MSRKHQKIDALATMSEANPVRPGELAAEIGAAGIERALARSIELGRAPSQPIPVGDRAAIDLGRAATRRRGALALVAAAVLAVLLVAGGWLDGPGGGRPQFAAAAVRVADANPRLLVTAPGWEVVSADQFEPDQGEVTFGDGNHQLDMRWYPARLYRSYLHDRDRVGAGVIEEGSLLGQRATTISYGRREFATMLSPEGNVFVEVRGQLGDFGTYEEILQSLRRVDVDAWLGAMPPSVVHPEDQAAVVEQLLRGTPLPPGFVAPGAQSASAVANRTTLGVTVANAVACGWVESWIAARRSGDEAAARQAARAMTESSRWPVVRRTKSPWFGNYEIVARQLRAGRLDRGPAGYEEANGTTFAVGPAWKSLLGCGDLTRTPQP